MSEMVSPRQSNRIEGHPAKFGLFGSRIAAAWPNHERDDQLVECDGMLPKCSADVVPGNLDDGAENSRRQGIASARQGPHLAAMALVRPIKETSKVRRLERESTLPGKPTKTLSHVVRISPRIEQSAELFGGEVAYDA